MGVRSTPILCFIKIGKMKIAIIGAGNMGGAIARGLAKGTIIQAEDICVANPSQGKLDALKAEGLPDVAL
mgnify:CR=1 FL=1